MPQNDATPRVVHLAYEIIDMHTELLTLREDNKRLHEENQELRRRRDEQFKQSQKDHGELLTALLGKSGSQV